MPFPIPPDSLPEADDAPEFLPPVALGGAVTQFPMEAFRSQGVVQTDDQDPYGAFLRFNKLFSSLRVRWKSGRPHRVISTLGNRAEMLGWDPRALKVVENITGVTQSLPRICPGKVSQARLKCHNNPDSETCPCSFLYGNDPNVWKGLPCPNQAVKAYQHFVRYIRDLSIQPEDHVDIQMVMDIIQLHLIEDQCAEDIQLSGVFEDKAAVVAQKDGKVHYDRKASEAVALRGKSQKERMDLYQRLMADRERREKMRVNRVKEHQEDKAGQVRHDLANLFSALSATPAIDTTFRTEPTDEEIQYADQE